MNGLNKAAIRAFFLTGLALAGLLTGCNGAPATPFVIYITATPAAVALVETALPDAPTPVVTPLFGPTSADVVTFQPLPTYTRAPTLKPLPSLTPSFTPEFTDTPTVRAPTIDRKKCAAALQPNGFTTLYQADKNVQTALGCAQSGPISINSATRTFENGVMIWASSYADQPRKVIYVLFSSGAYLRLDDTWTDGVDPVEIGDVAPPGKKAPTRGFGKVWKNNATARGLGWATSDENGTSAQIQRFDRGELLFVGALNQTFIFANGKWRADGARF